jgi:alkylation response protein AidB-like acyl-CoA dehydrogenase
MHGGYGFCDDYHVERFYRDCRVNRIFEGTNEINRFVIIQTLLKRAMAGSLDMMTELGNILQRLKSGFEKREPFLDAADQIKKLVIYVAGVAVQKYADKLQQHQALIAGVADMAIDAYVIDSGLGRAIKTKNDINEACVKVYLAEKLPHIRANARQLLINIAEGDEKEFGKYEKALDRIIPSIVYDTAKGKELIAAKILT